MKRPAIPHAADDDSPHTKAFDWLQYWTMKDQTLADIVAAAYMPPAPPFIQFVTWAIEHDLLKVPPDIDKEDDTNLQ